MFLIDTMVLSETFKRSPHPHAIAWLRTTPSSDLRVSVISVAEVEFGIARQQRRDPAFASRIIEWLERILIDYRDQLLPIDVGVTRRFGRLGYALGHTNLDLLIAATALEHGLTVATRNRSHFKPTGVPVIDPYESQDRAP